MTISDSSEDSESSDDSFIVDDPILSGDDETNTEQHKSAVAKSHKLLLSVTMDPSQVILMGNNKPNICKNERVCVAENLFNNEKTVQMFRFSV